MLYNGILVAMETYITLFYTNTKSRMFYLTSRDATGYAVRHSGWIHYATNQKSLRHSVQKLWLKKGFAWFGDLDLLPMFYFLSHALGMKYWNLHAKFHKNQSNING